MALDDAWAVDEPKGATGKCHTYRDLMGKLYEEATKSGNVAPSRKAIALAAKVQSDGSMRRAADKQRKPPSDFLWSWVDPDTKPN